MASVPFDTLKAFKELQDAGFDEAQAEAVIATVGQAFTGDLATKEDIRDMATKDDIRDMATKQDIADIRSEMATKDELAGVRREMATKADLHALEVRLMVRLGGLMLGAAGLIIAAIRLLS